MHLDRVTSSQGAPTDVPVLGYLVGLEECGCQPCGDNRPRRQRGLDLRMEMTCGRLWILLLGLVLVEVDLMGPPDTTL
jgi:hypothetical protein